MQKNFKKIVGLSALGNALEFYDFTVCGVFIAQISAVFFPKTSELAALFGGIFAFSAAFFTRPLGALLFGYLGDKIGRKKVLSLTIFLIAIPTLIIGILPGYATLGLWAPVILVGCRLMQGLSTGGEYNGAAIYALEHGLGAKQGLISGVISASCVLGALCATILGFFISQFGVDSWYWRLAFLFGGLSAIVGFIFRQQMEETEEFLSTKASGGLVKNPLITVLDGHKLALLKATTSGAYNGVLSYTLFSFLNIYVSRYLNFTLSKSLFTSLFGMLAFMITCPVFGSLSDRIGAKKTIMISTAFGICTPFLVFTLLQQKTFVSLIAGQLLLGTLVGSFVGPSHYFLKTLFKPELRYTGVSLGFCLGMALTGGTTAMLMVYLIEISGSLFIPAYLLSSYAALALVVFSLNDEVKFSERVDIQAAA